MYAIRSYYDPASGNAARSAPNDARAEIEVRITSYNVCYTKLIGSARMQVVARLGLRRGPMVEGTPAGDFRHAVGDMILMVCVETAIYSPVFTPGIVASYNFV